MSFFRSAYSSATLTPNAGDALRPLGGRRGLTEQSDQPIHLAAREQQFAHAGGSGLVFRVDLQGNAPGFARRPRRQRARCDSSQP